MGVTFQQESWRTIIPEARVLFPQHWAELALDQDKVGLHCDEPKYEQAEALGVLHIVTARCAGRLVGYYFGMLMHHLHYKDAGLMCYSDVYFLLPTHRKGRTGLRFLQAIEESLRGRGVVKMYISTKSHQDHGKLFERLGMKCSDRVFTKLLRS